MELNFIKDNNKYVSEFEVSSDFNLHIERNEGGTLYIQQRTGNGQYDTVKDAVFKLGDSVIDYDFQALVYPKYIKIVSDINPIAYITSDGEVTEIKSQTKEVEVTANGTTQVAPDAGYSYLTGVTVKTNVPQSGGSGGEGGEYLNDMLTEFYSIDWDRAKELGFDASSDFGFSAAIKSIIGYFALGKGSAMGMNILFNMSFFFANSSALSFLDAGGFCPIKVMEMGPEKVFNTFDDVIASNKRDYDISGIFTRITKEEFYTI